MAADLVTPKSMLGWKKTALGLEIIFLILAVILLCMAAFIGNLETRNIFTWLALANYFMLGLFQVADTFDTRKHAAKFPQLYSRTWHLVYLILMSFSILMFFKITVKAGVIALLVLTYTSPLIAIAIAIIQYLEIKRLTKSIF